MARALVLLCFLTLACGSSAATEPRAGSDASADAAGGGGGVLDAALESAAGSGGSGGSAGNDAALAPGPALGSFQLTYYWVASEDEHPGTKNVSLYDPACKVLAVVSTGFADAITLEGTGRLSDGRLLNYDGPCACPKTPCFFEADAAHPWGYGVQSRALVPFRSIAVDTSVITIGTRVYVAELDGVTMPGTSDYGAFVHDGCVQADDVGGGIQGSHIDFFAGLKAHYQALDGQLGLTSVTLHAGGARCP